ncbi:NLP-like protein [Plasmopara halstedii]|uniref:NLP-like protein n=1 Tax=Plasmopara halstedii TaxID=4781 RepID=A0A0P1B107_PLAHL|nr:NLP-like protein [Plasmopara halstedii]CEG46922.1 NLP-like protein [Plasmopara halstedii]|eukprot:XP_024583291.1 NLP-like protein [Plasmopara halstedii]
MELISFHFQFFLLPHTSMLSVVLFLVACINVAHADDEQRSTIHKLQYDEIKPIPGVESNSLINSIALHFQPMLFISSGCHPYPAVDEHGYISNGLGVSHLFTDCMGSPQGSQVYGRAFAFRGHLAIMYSWYFPRDFMTAPFYIGHRHGWEHAILWFGPDTENPTLLAVTVESTFGYKTYAPPPSKYMHGDHFKLKYTWLGVTQHYLTATEKSGEFQDLIMWDCMDEHVRHSLNHKVSHNFDPPIRDDRFFHALRKSFPF